MSIVRVLFSLVVTGLALGLAAVGAAGLSGHGHRWVDLAAQFVAPAFAAATVLTAAALMLNLRGGAAAAGLAAAVLAAAAWPQWFPAPPSGQATSAAADGPTVRLYSANIWVRNMDAERLARSIQAAQPDIVVLLEVNETMAGQLDQILPDHPYRRLGAEAAHAQGVRNVVAARTPLTPTATHLPSTRVQTVLGPITVVPTHLTRPWPFQVQWEQVRQAQRRAEIRHGQEDPVILAGDFNSISSARIGRQLRREAGVTAAPGWPGTWPSFVPAPFRMTIDQVYVTPELVVTRRRLGRPNGSDHSPVIVDLAKAR